GVLLVLFRERTRLAFSRQALSQGLQQASGYRLLESALCLALSLELVSGASGGEPARTRARAHAIGVDIRGSHASDLPGVVGADSGLLCHLHQSGVLHFS